MEIPTASSFTPQETLEALKTLFNFTSLRRNKIVNLPPLRFASEREETLCLLIEANIKDKIGVSILDYNLSPEQIHLYGSVIEGLFNQVLETMPDEDYQAAATEHVNNEDDEAQPTTQENDIEYLILTGKTPYELSKEVPRYLKSGYTLGAFSIAENMFAQVLTKGIAVL